MRFGRRLSIVQILTLAFHAAAAYRPLPLSRSCEGAWSRVFLLAAFTVFLPLVACLAVLVHVKRFERGVRSPRSGKAAIGMIRCLSVARWNGVQGLQPACVVWMLSSLAMESIHQDFIVGHGVALVS